MPWSELVDLPRHLATLSLGARIARSLVTPSAPCDRTPSARRRSSSPTRAASRPTSSGEGATEASARALAIYTGDEPIYAGARRSAGWRSSMPKNIILHFFVAAALVASAASGLRPPSAAASTGATLRERVQSLSRLFKYEFMFRADAGFDALFRRDPGRHGRASSPSWSAAATRFRARRGANDGQRTARAGLEPVRRGAAQRSSRATVVAPAASRCCSRGR